MGTGKVRFADWIQHGIELYKNNWLTLVLAGFIVMVLSSVTFGILAGPMYAGMIYLTLGLLDKREPKPQIGEVFKGFSYFLQAFLYVLVWGVIFAVVGLIVIKALLIGRVLFSLVQLVGWTLVSFALFLIVDKNLSFWDASKASFQLVLANFLPILGLLLVAGILASIGGILCGVGAILTAPIQVCIMAVAYRELFKA